MYYCGIDLASKASAICVMNDEGEIVAEFEIATDVDGFRSGLSRWSGLHCVVEASPLAEWTAQVLEAADHDVVIIDPRKAKAVIQTKKKTDRLDARNLARMARTGWYTAVHRKSAPARLLRSQLQARRGLVETTNAMNARIRGLLRAHGIKLGPVSAADFVQRVREVAKAGHRDLWSLLRPLCKVWREAAREAKALRKRIEVQSRQEAVPRRLMSVPGVGPMVATAFIATIDDPRRFQRGDQVAAYLGLTPSVHQSGETEYRGRITKEGDGLLRWLLVEAAHVLLTRTKQNCELKRWGLRLSRKKGHGKARVAVARKLAMLLHRLWLRGETFDWQRA